MSEREEIVDWLRGKHDFHVNESKRYSLGSASYSYHLCRAAECNGIADDIERGDHLNKDQKA